MSKAQELNEKLTTLMEDEAYLDNLLDSYEAVRGYIETSVGMLTLEALPNNFKRLENAIRHLGSAAKIYQEAEDLSHSDELRDQEKAEEMLADCYDEVKLAQKAFN